ncbi:MAG: putative sulfate exporter family transporter [Planctomycetota bacterium]
MNSVATSPALPAPARRRPFAGLGPGPGRALLVAAALLCVVQPVPGFAALLGGALVALVADVPAFAQKAGKQLLAWSIVALGFGTDLAVVARTGLDGVGAAAITLAVAFATGLLLSRVLRIDREVALLVTVGTAICGGSAIAAAAPVLRARSSSIGVALGVVFLLNAVALVLFPAIGDALGLDAHAFGRWCALAIHDTSSVVGAAAHRGTESLEIATVTKLARSLWIVPICFALSFAVQRPEGEKRRVPRPPLFIVLFVAAAGLVALFPALAVPGHTVAAGGRRGLTLALFTIGLGLTPASLRAVGGRNLALGVGLWVALGAVSLALV